MEVTCRSCQRVFELDDARITKVNSAKCVCGNAIDLRAGRSQRLGKYILQRKVAVGGMGEIWYAKVSGVEGFERELAIKKMLPHLSADRDFVNMLVKEAKLTVLLNHPNIVQVYDLAKEGDEYYIAMEYVPGINLGTLLEHCRNHDLLLPVPVATHIAMQTLKGLAYAHDLRGPDGSPMHILHRDITPQNILVTQAGWVKITDFGIAKAKNEISTTSPGMIKGKLGYIAPEQLEGRPPDHRVDLFCAGIVLWEMLACRRLFKGVDEIDTFRMVTSAQVPPMSEIRDDVPAAIEATLKKALMANPDARYLQAEEFYEALHDAMSPWTVDDCANETKAFLGARTELFAKLLESSAETEITDAPTVALKMDEKSRDITITDLMKPKQKPVADKTGSRLGLWITIVLLVLLIGGSAAWGYRAGWFKPQRPDIGGSLLTVEEVQLGVDAERPHLLDCYKQGRPDCDAELRATLVIASTGGVAKVALAEDIGKSRPCIERTLQALKYRTHPSPTFEAEVQLPSPPDVPQQKQVVADPGSNKPLTQDEIQAVVEQKFASIARCLQKLDAANAPAQLNATLVVQAAGKVSDVTLMPPVDPTVGKCLSGALRSMRFRQGPKGFSVTLPLKIGKS